MQNNLDEYLKPTYFMESDSEIVLKLASKLTKNIDDEMEQGIRLFNWTRDQIPYNPYTLSVLKRDYKASKIIKKAKIGAWCVPKAVVLATLARSVGIPSRLHFADIRNHQITSKLKKEMGTDIFTYHGYTELYLNGKWVKATPAFNKELCQKFNYEIVEFDGMNDALLPKKTLDGQKHVEYLEDRGTFADLPFRKIMDTFAEVYLFKGGTLNIFSRFNQ